MAVGGPFGFDASKLSATNSALYRESILQGSGGFPKGLQMPRIGSPEHFIGLDGRGTKMRRMYEATVAGGL